jgi:3-deoxy-D-manno-octulosonate 8-phosphate phosphatase (KDO 8-P phosphatase)
MSLEERAKKIKLFITDVDGVLTDGRIIYDNYGDELKCFNVLDGYGFNLLGKAGIKTAIITAKKSKAVKRRAQELKVDCVFYSAEKILAYEKLLKKLKLTDEEACFIGDDLIDLPLLLRCGLAVCVAGAIEALKARVHYVTQKEAGHGAAREVIELILKAQGKYPRLD